MARPRAHSRAPVDPRLPAPRRYVALGAGPRFFYFYETESLDVLQSPAYLERLGNPTPWTKRCIPYVINNKRTACQVSASLGHALGGVIAVIELGPDVGRADALRQWLATPRSPRPSPQPGIVAAHLGEANAAATTVTTDEKKLSGLRMRCRDGW